MPSATYIPEQSISSHPAARNSHPTHANTTVADTQPDTSSNDGSSPEPAPQPRQTRSMTAANKPISSRLRSSGHLANDEGHPYLADLSAHISRANSTPADPLTHRAATKSPHVEDWRQAELAELTSLKARHVWDLVPRPANANVITCKWVYKTKEDSKGNTVRRKARLVARGFTQVEGIDYEETFAPTAKFVTVRLIISLATSLNWSMEQADIDTAFLWSNITEDIYMHQLEGHVDPVYPNHVCKLLKSLYGLKQAAHLWNQLLSKTMRAANYQQLLTDTNCFVKIDQQGTAAMIAVNVDDLLIAARTKELIKHTIRDLQ